MTPQEIAEVRPRLLDFAAEMLGGLARKDQRAAPGELYVRGLLTDGERKSMQPMAARLGTDHQRLQQFITSSTWDYVAVRRNVARWFAASQPVEALVIDDTGFPKDGLASPCVARQYSGTLGKVANCQIAVSVHQVNEHASCAADWRLFCPQSWDDPALADPAPAARARRRRERACIPDQVRHTEKWRLALEMLEDMPAGGACWREITAAGGARPVVAADALAMAITPPSAWNWPPAAGSTQSRSRAPPAPTRTRPEMMGPKQRPGRPSVARLPRPAADPAPARHRQRGHDRPGDLAAGHQGRQRDNPDAAMTSHFLAIRVRPANRDIPRAADGSLPECWLLAEWPPGADEPTDYWLSNLPPDTPIAELARMAKIRWRIEHDYRELKTGLGLGHFEGRSFTGWHRHVGPPSSPRPSCTMIRTDPKDCVVPAAPLPGMRMAARMWPADVGSAWLCETVQKIDAGALTFGCPPVASRTRVSVSQFTFRGSAGGMRALFRSGSREAGRHAGFV